MTIKEMREKRHKLIVDMRTLNDKVIKETRAYTDEENAQYEQMSKDSDDLKKKIAIEERSENLKAEEKEIEERTSQAEKPSPYNSVGELRSVTALPEYRQIVNKFFRGEIDFRQVYSESQKLVAEKRALQADSDTAGGYLVVPQQFFLELLQSVTDLVQVRSVARIITLDKAESLGVPKLDTRMDAANWTTELQTGTADTGLAFGKRELRPHPLAKKILVSKKLLRQNAISAEEVVRFELSRVVADAEENAFMTGSGNAQPLGLFTASANGIPTSRDVSTGNSATSITFDGLKTAKGTLKRQYKTNATRWIFHRDAVTQISKLKDGNGRYLWEDSVKVGDPDMCLGVPVIESEFAPSTFTTGLYVGLIGDFRFYWIIDAMNMEVARAQELYIETNQDLFLVRKETDGAPVLSEAFVRVKLA